MSELPYMPGIRVSDIASEIDRTFVSVGSGNGSIEYRIQENTVHPIITVDPNPESYVAYPLDGRCIRPTYDYVVDLVKNRPSIVGNCVLFLCWPEYGEDPYDFDAIEALQPTKVIAYYEQFGGAGSNALHEFMNRNGIPNKYYLGIGPRAAMPFRMKKTIIKKNAHPFGVNTDVFVVLERV
jgi:hypothetical protein